MASPTAANVSVTKKRLLLPPLAAEIIHEDDATQEFSRLHSCADQTSDLSREGFLGGWFFKASDFEMGKELGSGSVGQVFQALFKPTQRQVAVKVPLSAPGGHAAQTLTLEDMLNETKIMASMGAHPNLLGLVGMLVSGAEPCIAMEFCGGGSVQDVFESKRRGSGGWRAPKATSFSWCEQLCSALHFLHTRQPPLVHRDVKPSNLFISSDLTRLKLGDFGLCRPVRSAGASDSASGDDRCMTGQTGTLAYMAPEVLVGTGQGGFSYDEKADVFSAAVCMRSMVTGEDAYEPEFAAGHGADITARRVALEGFRMPLTQVKFAPLAKLIAQMWAHDPELRPGAGHCAAQLGMLLTSVASTSLKPLALVQRTLGIGPSPKAGSGLEAAGGLLIPLLPQRGTTRSAEDPGAARPSWNEGETENIGSLPVPEEKGRRASMEGGHVPLVIQDPSAEVPEEKPIVRRWHIRPPRAMTFTFGSSSSKLVSPVACTPKDQEERLERTATSPFP
mmetsp:Transcript_67212/g.154372  ORF Transcript_67212/g.154372 Transcript_67212/m.154372 type:complete len:505 (-) Transcript_67212:46-1560(-)|eukprot:CAMPEP_0180136502 /NCGR_PEP_ID=MMETSP0986-20121125/11548_1 /TAXON_ID=697907 /ORGANISM="non described non described, Strain CCMP2293" /LENGTH=504 /DNA_ID=CAMNT_0022077571 /DNA_START=52 /DNA_END=1566 /DNA_ORIENTATION=+